MADKPIMSDVEINGRTVPFAEPQHFTGDSNNGRTKTGEKNPFPVNDKSVAKGISDLKSVIESKDDKVEITNQPDDYPDKDAKEELESIKETQSDIIKALKETNDMFNDVIKDGRLQSDTKLSGSNVEIADRVLGYKIDSENKTYPIYTNANKYRRFLLVIGADEEHDYEVKVTHTTSESESYSSSVLYEVDFEEEATKTDGRRMYTAEPIIILADLVRIRVINNDTKDHRYDIHLWGWK